MEDVRADLIPPGRGIPFLELLEMLHRIASDIAYGDALLCAGGAFVYGLATLAFGAYRLSELTGLVRRRSA